MHHLYDFEVIMGCIAWERTITIAGIIRALTKTSPVFDQAAKDDLLSSRATPQNPPDYHVEAAASFGDGGRAGTVQTLSYSAEMSLLV